jgi:hypothetical protein
MASVKFGAGVVQMSGSIAGVTHARNRFGNYIRPRTKPVNPNSTGQGLARSSLSMLVQRWRVTLTSDQRIAWATYAAAVAMKNRLGETVYMTGFNHYLRSNAYKGYTGEAAIDAGPTVLALPEKDPAMTIEVHVTGNHISVTFNNALPWANEAGGYLIIYQGQPQSHTRNFFNGPWKYCYRIEGATPVPPTSPGTITCKYTAVLGQKVWVYARIYRADGRISEPFVASAIVTAGA